MFNSIRFFAALTLLLGSQGFAAGVGDTLPALQLKDQYGKVQTLGQEVKRLYANADRKGDAMLKAALADKGQTRLDAQKAIVVAEISAAPFFVKSMIRGNLKDRGYLTWLDASGDTKKVLPYKEDQILILELDQQRITAVRYAGDVEALKRELGRAP